MQSIRVVDTSGALVNAVYVRQPFGIEIAFRVLKADATPIFPKFKLYDARRNVLFNAIDTSERWQTSAEPGDYVSTGWIPGNLLNEGLVSMDAGIWSIGAPKLHGHAGDDSVAFHVQDPGEGDSAK